MIGMILCGGYGKRMWPLTETIPKPLVELKTNYTILDRQLFYLAIAGIKKVVLLTGHLSEKIQERYGSNYKGIDIEYSIEDKPHGTLFAIKNGIEKFANEDVIIMNGDVVTDINLKKMVESWNREKFLVSMFVTKMRSPYGIVELEGESIKSFREKPTLDQYINGGVYCFSTKCQFDQEHGDMEKSFFPNLAKVGKLGHYKEDDVFWVAVDTIKELEEVRREYSNREDKPWGYEKVLVRTEKYMTKELFIKEGYSTSTHYHKIKDETLHIQKGILSVEFEDGTKKIFQRNENFRITPNVVHRLIAVENTVLQEVSTPQLNDSTRVTDYYSIR